MPIMQVASISFVVAEKPVQKGRSSHEVHRQNTIHSHGELHTSAEHDHRGAAPQR